MLGHHGTSSWDIEMGMINSCSCCLSFSYNSENYLTQLTRLGLSQHHTSSVTFLKFYLSLQVWVIPNIILFPLLFLILSQLSWSFPTYFIFCFFFFFPMIIVSQQTFVKPSYILLLLQLSPYLPQNMYL